MVGIVDRRGEQVAADAVLVAVFLLGAFWLLGGPPWRQASPARQEIIT